MRALLAAGCVLFAAACQGDARPASGERAYVGPPVAAGASPAQRFGGAPGHADHAAGPVAGTAGTAPGLVGEVAADFEHALPEGWVASAPTSMRAVNLAVAREPRAQFTLTLLGGDGGGLAANVDRWRAQMGLPPSTPAELASLPVVELLGRPAVAFDATGDYSGMGGASGADFRMVGRLAVAPEGSAFVKFVGPADVVAAELEAYTRVADSLAPRGAPVADARARDAAPGATPVAPSPTAAGGARLRWQAPPTWTVGPARMLREVTFTTDAAGTVECYVSVLGGDGGGIRANFDRWSDQMGAAPLSAEELAGLERVPSLGATALLVEFAGHFEGMGGETVADALMLGAVVATDASTVFVKLVGPRAAAESERANFRAFVASLEANP
jgi:hypothetical protein